MVEECPPEVWAIIFSMACRDNGNTAIALSRVSRLINTYSKPYRYQSIALTNCDQINAFESTIASLPPELIRIRNLFVHCPDPMAYVYTPDTYAGKAPDPYSTDDESSQSGSKDLTPKESTSEACTDADQLETDSESTDSDYSASESDSDSFYELTAEEETELAQEAEDLASMPDSTLQVRSLANLDWLEDSLSSLDRCQYAILSALRRILKAVAQSLENLTIHWLMYEHCLLEVMLPELPVIQDLSIFRKIPFDRSFTRNKKLLWSGPPTVFPSLKRLQIEGYLEEPESSLMEMAPTLMCLHTTDILIRKMLPVLPTTLRTILLHARPRNYFSPDTLKRELFGENHMEGVGEYARFLVDQYPENYEVWLKDWLARINNEGGALSCRPEQDP
ncbi:hypothetical protein K443DRAFT_381482 [Laccaria amethystina LaAM-08-1]|uniref:Uncharacterized protein n=1 Tax=Laccaria amethystina LaAM-08-1 TaxID=1095629 RepID=A0A0C9WIX6_9AGAR|nr:hypothetical protein K443DRAFT_381482 [Laccaria amethystina LaAM-08-1]